MLQGASAFWVGRVFTVAFQRFVQLRICFEGFEYFPLDDCPQELSFELPP